MDTIPPLPHPAEMERYGFDPANERDVREFMETTPADPDSPASYAEDAFEFGSEPRQDT